MTQERKRKTSWKSVLGTGLRGFGVAWLCLSLLMSVEQGKDISWQLDHLSSSDIAAKVPLERLRLYALVLGMFPLVGIYLWRYEKRTQMWVCLCLGVAAGWATLSGVPVLDLPQFDDTRVGAQAVLMPLTIGAVLLCLGTLLAPSRKT